MARYSVTYTAATTAVHYFGLQGIFVGDSLWCACGQVQVGLYADSYIPTTTAAVTRAADVAPSAPGVRPAGYIDAWQSYSSDSLKTSGNKTLHLVRNAERWLIQQETIDK